MFRGSSSFDKSLDKATSHLLLEPDWGTILIICDCIRQGDVQAKYAVAAIKKKLANANPHIVLYALQVLESCVKNCGTATHQEIANKQFMEEFHDFIKTSTNEAVKNKSLELIQAWAHAFRNEPQYRIVQDTVNVMKVEGYSFPQLKESDAMFVADKAPEWADAECCHRCRTQFGVVQRKHHCRNCGQVFCHKCSAKQSIIPKFGIEKEVRVCDGCYDQIIKSMSSSAAAAKSAAGSSSKKDGDSLPHEYLSSTLAQQPQTPPGKSEREIQEEEELQLALALSKSEAENKEKEKIRNTHVILSGLNNAPAPFTTIQSSAPPASDTSSLDSYPMELNHYLNRSYWEEKQHQVDPSLQTNSPPSSHRRSRSPSPSSRRNGSPSGRRSPSPTPSSHRHRHHQREEENSVHSNMPLKVNEKYQNGETDEIEDFMASLRNSLDLFVNRMKSNSNRGRNIATDTAVQGLFLTVTAMHSRLVEYLHALDNKRVYYEDLQDKVNQIKDARLALDALREDHRERLRREAEEAERQRQIQMSAKLEIMRQKKQEYLQYQRQIALQRMQEQEREIQIRHEQGLMRGHMGGYPEYHMPPGGVGGGGFNPDGSPIHNQQVGVATAGVGVYQPQGYAAPPMMGLQQATASYGNMYNMQGMANNLPQTTNPGIYQPAPMSGATTHTSTSSNLGPQPVNYLPTSQPVQQIMPPQQQQPPEVQKNPLEAELISFD